MTKASRGATLVATMLAMTIVIILSTIMLSIASSNLQRTNRQKLYQQAYLTVSSAANVLKQQIMNDSVTFEVNSVTTKVVDIDTGNEISNTTIVSNPTNYSYQESADGQTCMLKDSIIDFVVRTAADRSSHLNNSYTTNAKITSKINGEFLDEVNVDLSTDGFNLIMKFNLDPEVNVNYYLVTTFSCRMNDPYITDSLTKTEVSLNENQQTITTTTTDIYEVKYAADSIVTKKGSSNNE